MELSKTYALFLELWGADELHSALLERNVSRALQKVSSARFDWVVFPYTPLHLDDAGVQAPACAA